MGKPGRPRKPRVKAVCPTCGVTFETMADKPHTFCSRDCHVKSVMVTYGERVCRACGEKFVAKRPAQRFCSNACRPKKVPHTCSVCGKEFLAYASNNRTMCSHDCSTEYQRSRELRACRYCGRMFLPSRQDQAYCSRDCFNDDRRTKPKPEPVQLSLSTCVMCGALVLPPRTRFCSNSCGERHRKTQRRAKKRAVYLEDVTLAALRARDGDNCGICGESIDFSVEYPDKMCPTIDHVVPIVAGGMHEMSNCQIAHFICNSRKGGRVA